MVEQIGGVIAFGRVGDDRDNHLAGRLRARGKDARGGDRGTGTDADGEPRVTHQFAGGVQGLGLGDVEGLVDQRQIGDRRGGRAPRDALYLVGMPLSAVEDC